MAFHFSLAMVLRLREIAEQREERRMGQILSEITQGRQRLADLTRERDQLLALRERALQAKMSAAELLLVQAQIRDLEDREESSRKHLSELDVQRQAPMKVYEAAHRNRELLSSMCEEQKEQFQRAQMRKEQLIMDDNFSCRRLLRYI
jgi:flagellar export protein FliJ